MCRGVVVRRSLRTTRGPGRGRTARKAGLRPVPLGLNHMVVGASQVAMANTAHCLRSILLSAGPLSVRRPRRAQSQPCLAWRRTPRMLPAVERVVATVRAPDRRGQAVLNSSADFRRSNTGARIRGALVVVAVAWLVSAEYRQPPPAPSHGREGVRFCWAGGGGGWWGVGGARGKSKQPAG